MYVCEIFSWFRIKFTLKYISVLVVNIYLNNFLLNIIIQVHSVIHHDVGNIARRTRLTVGDTFWSSTKRL